MPRLDSLLVSLASPDSREVVLQTGVIPYLRRLDGRAPLLKQPLATAQIVAAVREILPPDLRTRFPVPGETRFVYPASSGPVSVVFEMNGERATALFTASGDAPEAEVVVPSAPKLVPGAEGPAMAIPHLAEAPSPVEVEAGPAPGSRRLPEDPCEAIDELLGELESRGGSDLHLRSNAVPIFRVDGEVARAEEFEALSPAQVESLALALAPDRNRAELSETSDTDFAVSRGETRFRVNLLRDRHGVGLVARLIPGRVRTAEELGLSPALLSLCELRKGLVLVTGPTGSGKSTTLAAMVDRVNETRADHILTIEDPIEFVHAHKRSLVTQREVHVHTHGFKEALRAALREDPDVVLVGELRDLETVEIALETAETGHLVFGTLHTSTAPATVDRIIDQFPAARQAQVRTALSETLKGVVAQTLCKRIGGGRVAALEVLLTTPAVSNLIREGKTFQIASAMQTGKNLGMCMLNDALIQLVKSNQIEPSEALSKAIAKTELAAMLQQAGHGEAPQPRIGSASRDGSERVVPLTRRSAAA